MLQSHFGLRPDSFRLRTFTFSCPFFTLSGVKRCFYQRSNLSASVDERLKECI